TRLRAAPQRRSRAAPRRPSTCWLSISAASASARQDMQSPVACWPTWQASPPPSSPPTGSSAEKKGSELPRYLLLGDHPLLEEVIADPCVNYSAQHILGLRSNAGNHPGFLWHAVCQVTCAH